MAEPWVEAEARRLCEKHADQLAGHVCQGTARTQHRLPCGEAMAIAAGIRAGLNRAAVICGNRANDLVARNMSDYKNGAFDEAEACARAIEDAAK